MAQEQDEVETIWCERCMEMVEVVERFEDTMNEYAGQRGYRVTALECGHDIAIPDGTFYPW